MTINRKSVAVDKEIKMKKNIIIGSRESRLAVIQSELIKEYIENTNINTEVSLLTMKTTGDMILDRTLDKIGGKGLFVKELDKALLDKKSDISVHSLKDMPMELPEELPIIAFSKREDPRDVLVLPKGTSEMDMDKPIGCSGPRRVLQVKELFPDCQIKSIRGNILTRLKKLDDGEYGALILAAAGLKRLGLEDRIFRYFEPDEIIPAAGQGILAVQGRKGEDYSCLAGFEDRDSALEAKAERAFVRALDGGCSSPVTAFSVVKGDTITIKGLYFNEVSGQYIKGEISGAAGEGADLGCKLALELKEKIGTEKAGKVWLVGAGPGDLGLFTLKGMEVLKNADVVVYDRLVGHGVLACIPPTAKLIDVGKKASHHTMKQEGINQVLVQQAKRGLKVVRLKGGDPFLFGRGGEELELLIKEGIPYEVVPGVTAAIAVPAYNGIPVTHRDFCSSVHIITGHKRADEQYDIDFEALVRTKGTLLFLMGVTALPDICNGLMKGGMDPNMPAAILQQGTTAGQKRIVATVATLEAEVARQGIETPAIIAVGSVCTLADSFGWYEKLPLMGKKIMLTRPQNRPSIMARNLRALGGEVIELPAIQTLPCRDQSKLHQALQELNQYQWLVFTSPYGAQVFFDEMMSQKIDLRKLAQIKIAVVGATTRKAVEDRGLMVDFMPTVYEGSTLGKELAKACMEHGETRILMPRAEQGSADILGAFEKKGLMVNDVAIYKTVYMSQEAVAGADLIDKEQVNCVVFTSASAVRGFVRTIPQGDFTKVKAACIGKQTEAVAKKYGMTTYVSEKATLDSLSQLICDLSEQGVI